MNEANSRTYPELAVLKDAVLAAWPEHERYLDASLASRDVALLHYSDLLSGMILKLAEDVEGGVEALARDYRFFSEEIILPEEWHFRRNGQYRLTSFAEALETIYSNGPFMTRYMNGLLVSDVFWANHCRSLQHYANQFIATLPKGANLLEIGPGHGLLLCLASRCEKVGSLTGWDVSAASLDATRQALKRLDVARPVSLVVGNIFEAHEESSGHFDAVVCSEVLEHLEHPSQALQSMFRLCKPGGRVWINIPANSPAPDHITLIKHPSEAVEMVKGAGFEIVDSANFAGAGATLERALKQALTISCIVVGRKPQVS